MPTPSDMLDFDLNSEPTGRPALLIHALLGHRGLMNDLAEFWRSEYGSTLCVDLPGHGNSPMPTHAISIEASAAAIGEVLDHTGLEKPVLIGHSMGGLVALELAAQRPDEVAGVILMDPAPIILDPETREGWGGLLEMLKGEAYQDAKQILIDAQSGPFDNQAAAAARAELMQKIAPESLIQSFGSMLDWSGESTLAKVTVPVAGFWSGRNGEPDALLEHKPEAMIGQVIASGHYVHLEATEQIQAMIKRCMQAWKL